MLLQLGSHHAWLVLLLVVPDATWTAPHTLFQEQEDTRGCLSLFQGIIEGRGIPLGWVNRWAGPLPG